MAKLGEIVVFPLWPRADEAAKRVLVRARVAARTPLVLAAGLVLHEADGKFTARADAILRDGAELPLL
jgi:tRNA1(Val) A37 N6-methylase TrmN6